MNNILTWLKMIVLTPVVIVGVILCMVLGVLFKNSILPNLDFGSVPDWCSALSSIFTTFIAWKAFKAAPNWFKQKLDESAIHLAVDLVENHAPKLDLEIRKIISINADARRKLESYADNRAIYSDFDLKSKIEEAVKSIENMAEIFNSVDTCENALKKRGWAVQPYYSYKNNGTKEIYEYAKSYTTIELTKYLLIENAMRLFREHNIGDNEINLKELQELHKKIEDVIIRIYIYTQNIISIKHMDNLFR